MKKVLAAVCVVCVVFGAGAALAQPKANNNARRLPPQQMQQGQPGPQFNGAPCFCGRNDDRGPRGNWQQGGYCEPGRYCDPRQYGQRGPQGMPGEFDGRGPRGGRMMFTPDMPDEIRETAVKIAKLRIDLEAALAQKPIDKTAALEAFTKIHKLEQEIEVWRFEKKLDQMEAFRTQQELNRKMPPAPPAPKPEVKSEAPAPEAKAE